MTALMKMLLEKGKNRIDEKQEVQSIPKEQSTAVTVMSDRISAHHETRGM